MFMFQYFQSWLTWGKFRPFGSWSRPSRSWFRPNMQNVEFKSFHYSFYVNGRVTWFSGNVEQIFEVFQNYPMRLLHFFLLYWIFNLSFGNPNVQILAQLIFIIWQSGSGNLATKSRILTKVQRPSCGVYFRSRADNLNRSKKIQVGPLKISSIQYM